MKLNLKQMLVDLEGKVIELPEDEEGTMKEVTIKEVVVKGLLLPDQTCKDPKKQMERFTLAQDIYKAEDEFEVKSEQVTLIKERVANLAVVGMSPMLIGQTIKVIDG